MHTTSNGIATEGEIVEIPNVEDFFDELMENLPKTKQPSVDLNDLPREKRFSYEYLAERTGYSVEQLKAAAVFELHIPINPRPKDSYVHHIYDATNRRDSVGNEIGMFSRRNNTAFQTQVIRSPPKLNFHTTPSLPSFPAAGIQPVPMSPSVNLFPIAGNLPTHSTPSLGAVGASLTMTVTRHTKDQIDACRRNFSAHNQTMSLDSGTQITLGQVVSSTTMVITAPSVDEPDLVVAPSIQDGTLQMPSFGKKGEKLNRTFTKEDLLLMKQQGQNVMEQTMTKFPGEGYGSSSTAPENTSDNESESLSCDQPETITSSSSTEFQQGLVSASNLDQTHHVAPVVMDPVKATQPLQPKQTSVPSASGIARPASGLPAPTFSSRLVPPKFSANPISGSNPSLVGSVSSLASNSSQSHQDNLGNPPPLTRAGTFTKDQPPSVPLPARPTSSGSNDGNGKHNPRKTMVVQAAVLPNKMMAPRASVAPAGQAPVRRANTTGSNLMATSHTTTSTQSMNVHAYRYPAANQAPSSRPSTAGSTVGGPARRK